MKGVFPPTTHCATMRHDLTAAKSAALQYGRLSHRSQLHQQRFISGTARSTHQERIPQPPSNVEAMRLKKALRTYNSAITACGITNNWKGVCALLEDMHNQGIREDTIIVSAAMKTCSLGAKWDIALRLFEGMRRNGLNKDVISYGVAISACEKGALWNQALRILDEMLRVRVQKNTITYSAAVSACEKCGQWEAAIALFAEMKHGQVQTNTITFSAAISACGRGRPWSAALLLFAEMEKSRAARNTITYNATINAFGHDRPWEHAQELLANMVRETVHRDIVTYNSAISAVGTSGPFNVVLLLLDDMQRIAVKKDTATYCTAISASEKKRQWEYALFFLSEMSSATVTRNSIIYNATISACGKGHRWSLALELLREQVAQRFEPDTVGYNATILACSRSERWEHGLALLDEFLTAEGDPIPEVMSYCVLLSSCEQRGIVEIEQLLLQSLSATICGRHGAGRKLLSAAAKTAASRNMASSFVSSVAAARLRRVARSNVIAPSMPYAKELRLYRHVLLVASHGDPVSVCRAIERFGEEVLSPSKRWLKILGSNKVGVLTAALRQAPPGGGVLEIGTYCGYSAMMIAMELPGINVVTLEVDPVHVVIARSIIAFAGLSNVIDVWTGYSRDLFSCIAQRYSRFSAIFMDQRGSRYHEDLQALERYDLLQNGAILVADNVLKPGAPLFLWRVSTGSEYKTQIARVVEFAMQSTEDWISISVWRKPHAVDPEMVSETCPRDLLLLNRESDHIRERARSQLGVTYAEWATFSAHMRRHLSGTGITASMDARAIR